MHSLINSCCEIHFHLLGVVFSGVIDGGRGRSSVEFALHPQHETPHDSEIQTKQDLKSKFRKQPGSLSIISLNSKDKERALEC